MGSLTTAIKDELGSSADLEMIDLHQLAMTLQPYFPSFPISQLTLEIAKVAVESGCRYFVWEPPTQG